MSKTLFVGVQTEKFEIGQVPDFYFGTGNRILGRPDSPVCDVQVRIRNPDRPISNFSTVACADCGGVMVSRSFQSIIILLVLLIVAAPPSGAFQTPKGPPATVSSSAIERSYAGGNGIPSRRVQTRTESNGRE